MARTQDARRRRRYLIDKLRTQSDRLCESHTQDAVARILKTVLELYHNTKMNDDRREELAAVFRRCGLIDEPEVQVISKREMYVCGMLDVIELSRFIVWGGVVDGGDLKTVEG